MTEPEDQVTPRPPLVAIALVSLVGVVLVGTLVYLASDLWSDGGDSFDAETAHGREEVVAAQRLRPLPPFGSRRQRTRSRALERRSPGAAPRQPPAHAPPLRSRLKARTSTSGRSS